MLVKNVWPFGKNSIDKRRQTFVGYGLKKFLVISVILPYIISISGTIWKNMGNGILCWLCKNPEVIINYRWILLIIQLEIIITLEEEPSTYWST